MLNMIMTTIVLAACVTCLLISIYRDTWASIAGRLGRGTHVDGNGYRTANR